MPVLATTLVGGLLGLAAYAGSWVLAAVVVAAAALLAYGLLAVGDVPDRATAGALVVLTAAGAAVAVLAADVELGSETSFAPVLRAAGPAMVAVLLGVLARPRARAQTVAWLAATASGVLLAALLASVVALGRLDGVGPELVTVAAVGAVVGSGAGVGRDRLGQLAAAAALGAAVVAAFVLPVGTVEQADRLVVGGATALAAAVAAAAVSRASEGVHALARSALVSTAALAVAVPVACVCVRLLLT